MRITRKHQKIFGGNSSNNGVFGSGVASGGVLDNDPDAIQSLPAWEGGWNPATISGEKLPALEEIQGIEYVTTRQIAYLFQEGIPEWDTNTEYHENSLVKESGTVKIYKSLTDDNKGNPLSDGVNWDMVVDFDNPSYTPPQNNYTATTDPTVNDDSGDGYSVGSTWFNTSTGGLFFCVSSAVGAANWQNINTLDGSVTNAKLANMAANTVKVNNTNSSASPSDISIGTNQVLGRGSGNISPLSISDGLRVDGSNITASIGSVVGFNSAKYTANADLTVAIPRDDTVPLITEGTQILEVKITPKKSGNLLKISFSGTWAASSGVSPSFAIFINGTSTAYYATGSFNAASVENFSIAFETTYTTTGTTEQTITLRVGPNAGTMRMNGRTDGRYYGGVASCELMVEEILK